MQGSSVQQSMEQAVVLHRAGRLAEAEAIYRDVLTRDSNHADALYLLGLIARQTGHPLEAGNLFQRSVNLSPHNALYQLNLGDAQVQSGNVDGALRSYLAALRADPAMSDARARLIAAVQNGPSLDNLLGVLREAAQWCPDSPEIHATLGNTLTLAGLPAEAASEHRKAIAIRPDWGEFHANLGAALLAQGLVDQAIAAQEAALSLRPNLEPTRSDLLYARHFLGDFDPRVLYASHVAWGASVAARIPPPSRHENSRDRDRRLRIGYVSADLFEHPVGRFLLPILAHRDRNNFEVHCYSNGVSDDDLSRRLRECSDRWRPIASLSDEEADASIRSDRIDILVDLSGHTGGNRLPLFARKPAPVQATYLGYPDTTGLASIDYRLTDALADPPGASDSLSTERLIRMPDGFLCYPLPPDLPDMAALLPAGTETVTFGSFNKIPKIIPRSLALWADVLSKVSGSRLLIKAAALAEPAVREDVLCRLASLGISRDRIELLGPTATRREHLEAYRRIDIALDTFPYNGTTTTFEALAMGAAVITLAGNAHVSRVGASILTHAGLDRFIAKTPGGFVDIAVGLAANRDELTMLRRGLRDRLANSPMCDGPRFARSLEGAYRQMWHDWCDRAADQGR